MLDAPRSSTDSLSQNTYRCHVFSVPSSWIHVEAIFTRLKKVVWQNHVDDVTGNLRRTPILATVLANKWEQSWEDQPAKVRACRQVRVKGRKEEWVMATCATPGLVTISPKIRLCRHK